MSVTPTERSNPPTDAARLGTAVVLDVDRGAFARVLDRWGNLPADIEHPLIGWLADADAATLADWNRNRVRVVRWTITPALRDAAVDVLDALRLLCDPSTPPGVRSDAWATLEQTVTPPRVTLDVPTDLARRIIDDSLTADDAVALVEAAREAIDR